MILLGGIPGRLVLGGRGLHGITPAQIATGGDYPSPLANDINLPDDATTRLLWVLLPPLPSSGTTQANDFGGYALVGADDGTITQGYRLLWMPATGAPGAGETTITVIVSNIPTLSAPTFVPGSKTASGWRGRITAT